MKKLVVLFLAVTSLVSARGFLFWGDENESKGEIIAQQQASNQRWERIKELEKRISFDRDKTRLERNYKEYKKEFDLYMEELKSSPEQLFNIGDYYFKDGRYEKAYEVFSKDDTNIKNVFGAATTAKFLNNNEVALNLYSQAISMDPNFYESYLGRGIINRNIGNYNEAINDLKKYMEYKKDESAYMGLGELYMLTNNYAEAKNILEIGRNRYPHSVVIKDMLIRTYAELKNN